MKNDRGRSALGMLWRSDSGGRRLRPGAPWWIKTDEQQPLEEDQPLRDHFARTLADGEHVVLVLDQAGWHGARTLRVPGSITLLPLPPFSAELNPVERIWLYLKERFLSHRLHADYDAITQAACSAWHRLCAEPGRIKSLCS